MTGRERHPAPLDRRTFLRASAMAIAGGTLFSCTGGRTVPRVDPSSAAAVNLDTRWPIKRVIYLMLENRSFDNVFGRFPGVNGTTVGVMDGAEKPLLACPDWLPGDLAHDRKAALANLNRGQLDGFGIAPYGDPWAYTQFTGDEIPAYWHWAREYAISDNFFASALGPSYPNHFFYIAGQSAGVVDTPVNIGSKADPATTGKPGGGVFKSWGCDSISIASKGVLGLDEEDAAVYVVTLDEDGRRHEHEPCFTFPTMGGQLTHQGIDWSYYAPLPGYLGYFWNAYNAIDDVFHTDLWQEHAQHDIGDLVGDIQAGTLPSVTWAVPHFQLSDHPPASSAFTHNWVMDVVGAVMDSDMWDSTAIFLTWDEWGGFYDHVEPPAIDATGLGFRVPLLTISPYTRRGLIDTELGEFSAPLRFIADNWGLPYLSPRIEQAHNMEHLFDFAAPPREPSPAPTRAVTFGDPYSFPESFPDWPPGTLPSENPFG